MSLDYSYPQVTLLIGSPRKGKSNAIKYFLLNQMLNPAIPDEKKYKFGIVMTGSKFNNDYKYLPQDYVFEGVDHEELDNYLEALEEMKEESDYIPPSFVCFDDLVGILSKFDGPLNNFFSKFRHYNVHLYISVQHISTGASTLLREITTKAVMFNAQGHNTINHLFESFGQSFERYRDFKDFFLEHTKEPYTALVRDADDETFSTFKAPDMSDVDVHVNY